MRCGWQLRMLCLLSSQNEITVTSCTGCTRKIVVCVFSWVLRVYLHPVYLIFCLSLSHPFLSPPSPSPCPSCLAHVVWMGNGWQRQIAPVPSLKVTLLFLLPPSTGSWESIIISSTAPGSASRQITWREQMGSKIEEEEKKGLYICVCIYSIARP